MLNTNNCYILGQGAISSLLIAGFKNQQLAIKTIGRKPQVSNYSFTDHQGNKSHFSLTVMAQPNSAIELLILPVKAYQVLPAIQQLKSFISDSSLILLMHNGLGTIEPVSELLPNNQILFATTTHGAYKPTPESVIHTGLGQSEIGYCFAPRPTKTNEQLTSLLNLVLPPFKFSNNITETLWRKLAVNAIINPLTAIDQISNGELDKPKYQNPIQQLCEEIAAIAQAEAIMLRKGEISQLVHSVIKKTAANYSSMNRDIASGRKSEIDFINGYLVKKARQHNISAPINEKLHQLVSQIEGK